MNFFRKVSDSATLVSGMAERLDMDYAARVAASPDEVARSFQTMVLRCMNCSDQDGCAKLQDENPMLDDAPDFCRNKDILRRK